MIDCFFVADGVRYITQTVTGSWKSYNFHPGGAICCNLQRHITGDKIVCFAMDQKDGNPGLTDGSTGSAGGKAKLSEKKCGEMDDWSTQCYRIVPVLTYLLDNGSGGGVGGVCDNTGHIVRHGEFGSHQHRSGTHGNAGQKNRRIISKPFRGIFDPTQTVMALFDAKTDGFAAAISVTPLIDNQNIISHFSGKGMAAAAVPEGVASVAVEQDLYRRMISEVVVSAVKGDTVVGFCSDCLAGILTHDACDAVQMF